MIRSEHHQEPNSSQDGRKLRDGQHGQRNSRREAAAATAEAGGATSRDPGPFTAADVDDFFVWASDDRVASFCSYEAYTSKEALLWDINNSVLFHHCYLAICLDGDGGRPVGALFLTPPYGGVDPHRAELGYVLAYDYWGKGIMTAAVRELLETVFVEHDGLERIEVLVEVGNRGSQRVLEKVGFQREGVLRRYWEMKGEKKDMVMYSLLSTDEWLSH